MEPDVGDALTLNLGITEFESPEDATYNDHAYAKVNQFVTRRRELTLVSMGYGECGIRNVMPEGEKKACSHGCCGNFDSRDQCRDYTDISKLNPKIPTVIKKNRSRGPLKPNEGPKFCTGDAINCRVETPEMIADHSIYDIKPGKLCEIMYNKKCTRLLATMCFDPRMIVDDSGKNPCFSWTVEGDDFIMTMGKGKSESYIHSTETIRRYTKPGIQTSRVGYTVMWRIIEVIGYNCIIEFTPLFHSSLQRTINIFINENFLRISG